jgi:unsaturated rhamnogalacturonyl hydrolase
MFVYALAKAVRLGYLDDRYAAVARRGYDGILRQFVKIDWFDRQPNLKETCQVAGLGGLAGKPYRDGSFDYYISEPRKTNDPKGVAAFILASLEIESMRRPTR